MGRRRTAAAAVALAALASSALAIVSGGSAGRRCAPHWVAAWTANPTDAASPLSAQTARMIVAPHAAGDRLRIRLGNRFADAPTTLGPVTVAATAAGARVVPGTLHQVLFAGRPRVTIPAGGEAASDPVAMSVRPFADLSVSVAVAGSVEKPTEHLVTRQPNYLSPPGSGDHSADVDGSSYQLANGSPARGWYFLDGVDVLAPGRTGAVVALGDSLTDGFERGGGSIVEDFADVGQNLRYPDDLARRLLAADRPLSVVNAGIGGNRLLEDGAIPAFGPSAIARAGVDVVAQPGATDVIVLEGINDIGETDGITASDLTAGLEQLVEIFHGAGLRVLLGTLTPAGGTHLARYGGSDANDLREHVNAWIRTQHVADAVVDFDAAVRDPHDPSRLAPAFDGGDHLHLSAAGYQRMADAVDLAQLRGGACSARPAAPSLRLRVTPRSVTAGQRVRLHFEVGPQPVAGATATFGGLHARTDRRGEATLVVRLAEPGSYLAAARAGRGRAVALVRVRR